MRLLGLSCPVCEQVPPAGGSCRCCQGHGQVWLVCDPDRDRAWLIQPPPTTLEEPGELPGWQDAQQQALALAARVLAAGVDETHDAVRQVVDVTDHDRRRARLRVVDGAAPTATGPASRRLISVPFQDGAR